VQNMDLPNNLDLTGINATHENGELRVAIPFKDASNQQREIDILPS
jgi:HSP20 family protein